jgi:hypothetical protein
MKSHSEHSALEKHIIKTLLYFDIFHYPLKREEVFQFLGMNSVNQGDIDTSLKNLTANNFLHEKEAYFGFDAGDANAIRRTKGNALAAEYIPLAQKQAGLIASFPFVRAVLASGSLSKNYMDEKSDLDFFIITAPGRLWIARTLLVLYKRVFLFNSHRLFCANYFVDEDHLEIEEKNQFTATELATVLPLYNHGLYDKLIADNNWLKKFFPNFKPRQTAHESRKPENLKKLTENLLNIVAVPVEYLFMKITFYRWQRIYAKHYNQQDFQVAFKTKKYASKNHPNHYQKKVIDRYLQKIREYCDKHNVQLD